MAIEKDGINAIYLLGDIYYGILMKKVILKYIVKDNKYLEYAMFDILLNAILYHKDMNINNIELIMNLNMGVELKNKDIIDLYGTALYCKWKLHYDEKKDIEFIKISDDLGNKDSIETYAEFRETGFGVKKKNIKEAKRYREMIINDNE